MADVALIPGVSLALLALSRVPSWGQHKLEDRLDPCRHVLASPERPNGESTRAAVAAIDDLAAREAKAQTLSVQVTQFDDCKFTSRTDITLARPSKARVIENLGDGGRYWTYSNGRDVRKYSRAGTDEATVRFEGSSIHADMDLGLPFGLDQFFDRHPLMVVAWGSVTHIRMENRPVTVVEVVRVLLDTTYTRVYLDDRTGWPFGVQVTSSRNDRVTWYRFSNLHLNASVPDSAFIMPRPH